MLLQRKGADGDFHDVGVGRVKADGTLLAQPHVRHPGTKVFRTRILGGRHQPGRRLGAR